MRQSQCCSIHASLFPFSLFPLPLGETLFTRAFCHSASFLSCSHHAIAEAWVSLTRSDWFGGMERTKVPSYPAKTPRRKRSPSLSPLVKVKVKSSRFNCNCLEMYFCFCESLQCTFGTKQQGNPHWTLLWVLHSTQGANLRRFFRNVANCVPIQSPYDKTSKHVHHAANRNIIEP